MPALGELCEIWSLSWPRPRERSRPIKTGPSIHPALIGLGAGGGVKRLALRPPNLTLDTVQRAILKRAA